MTIDEQRLEIEPQRLELDKKRLEEIEKKRVEIESRFFHKHLGIIATFIVSIATATISYTQIYVADIRKSQELEISQKEQERRWKIDVAKFVFDNKSLIFSQNKVEREQIRDVMIATFPLEITDKLFLKLEATATQEQKTDWKIGQNVIDSIIDTQNSIGIVQQDLKSDVTLPSEISENNIKKLIDDFKGENRKKISKQLADLYSKTKNNIIIEGLINSILPEDDDWSYRVNLYIVVTLELIDPYWKGTPEQFEKINNLKQTRNYNDKTFKKRVDGAISNYQR